MIKLITGNDANEYITAVANLRIQIFKEFPYIYEGDIDYEKKYLRKFIDSPDSLFAIAFDEDNNVIGALTGLPLEFEEDEVKEEWLYTKYDISEIYYFSEALILSEHRGKGLGVKLFNIAEQWVKKLNKYSIFTLATVIRPINHPLKPEGYISYDSFWSKRGDKKTNNIKCSISRKDIGETFETKKDLLFWFKKIQSKSLDNIELQAELMRQDHRWSTIIKNIVLARKNYSKDDPRYDACVDALISKIIEGLIPGIVYIALGSTTIIALIVSIQSLLSIEEQNIIESRAFLFDHAREIQKIFIETPEMYDYFYLDKNVPDTLNSLTKRKILITAEMMTDMLDNAAGSRIKDLSEGWSEYANDIYNHGPAFRDFYLKNKNWYPNVVKLLQKPEMKEKTFFEKLKVSINDL